MRSRRRSVLADQVVAPRSKAPLYVVRAQDPPPLELPPPVRAPWYDAPIVGVAIVVTMLVGVVLAAIAMGWVRT